MFYTDYKDAAERHLETCYNLVEKLNIFEDKKQKGGISTLESKTQMNLLSNLYYLSGYMFECLYNYAICKKGLVPDNLSIRDLDRVPPNGTYGTLPICFNANKKNTNIRHCLQRSGHRMTLSDLSFLDSYANSENIPLLHNNNHFAESTIRVLFDNWSVYERYKINYDRIPGFPFNFHDILRFFWEIVDVCAKLSIHILREVTLFQRVVKKKP